MPETFTGETRAENRRFPRKKLKLWVHFACLTDCPEDFGRLESLSEDLGAGGIAIRSDHQLSEGQLLTLTLFLPPEDKQTGTEDDLTYAEAECVPIDVQGRVRWCTPRDQMEYLFGVEFNKVKPEHRESLTRFLLNYDLVRPGSEAEPHSSLAAHGYHSLAYFSPERLGQYYFQLNAVREAAAKKVLEIGKGPGVVAHVLQQTGIDFITCDADPDLSPDVCGDVRKLPLPDDAVDFSLCCQVLEHLPFSDFTTALRELKRVTRGQILISIPYASRVIYAQYKLPGGRRNSWVVHFPWLPPKGAMTPEHQWEQGRPGSSPRQVREAIRSAGLIIQADFSPVESPKNQFFLLTK